jgi:DNA invertase Pin-like site-specific DNA recombinase
MMLESFLPHPERILDFAGSVVDTEKARRQTLITVFGAFAEFERNLMLVQREGIAKAKADGKYKGRKPTARAKADEVQGAG